MASSKVEICPMAKKLYPRPAANVQTKEPRPVSGSLPRHVSSSRTHSHSISLGASNPAHRINRRKSVNAQASSTATAAVAAALREQGGDASAIPFATHRRSLGSKKGLESQSMGARPPMSTYFGGAGVVDQDALEDNSNEDEAPSEKKTSTKARNRRASEGSFLKGEGGKRVASELRCDTCGKGYKHSSCLTKHLWEHDPAWQYTSKLLISKHQQVQLLEAASVLYNMNSDAATANPEAFQADPSEVSSGSPIYSGSEGPEDLSSVETTPPPMGEPAYMIQDGKRYSTQSSTGFSRSYRSIPSSSFAESALSPGLPPHLHFGSNDARPGTSGTDDSGLAAAAELLNFGTPRTRPTHALSDVPPVPPLPQQYQSLNNNLSGSTSTTVYNPLVMHPTALTQPISDERDLRMEEEVHNPAANHQEDEEMFRMDE